MPAVTITAARASERVHPHQPGLGNLNKLPLELRQEIWKHFVPRQTEPNGIRNACQPSRPCNTGQYGPAHEPPFPPPPINGGGDLAVLRASKQLYEEITNEIYLNRVLTICFSDQDHFEGCWEWYRHSDATGCGRSHFWTTMGGICYWSDLAEVDFSRFSSMRLNIRFRSEGDGEELAVYLHGEVDHFVNLVQRWQTRKSSNAAGPLPSLKFDITIDICPKDPGMDDPSPVNEINLDDIKRLLVSLKKIRNVRVQSVEVGFALRFGQEWLVEMVRQAVKYIEGSPDCTLYKEGSRLQEALERAKKWTYEPLDNTDHGALNLKLPKTAQPEGMSVSVRHMPERDFITGFLGVYGWMVNASVVTKVTFT
ncbi:MAG: hypothetical protein Q9184_002690 [Pyrenodesmia sp. 2 TL-2023]